MATTKPPGSSSESVSGPTGDDRSSIPEGEHISFAELTERGDALDGVRVTFTASAFFLEECPPPDGQSGPCSILLFLADPERTELLYGDRDQALPGWVDGVRVSCEVGPETRTACPGWTAGARYEVTGTVRIATNRLPEVHIDHFAPLS